jgi:hypothetical protein
MHSEERVREVVANMYNIKNDIYARTDIELKASNVLRPKSVTQHFNNKLFVDRVVSEVLCGVLGIKVFAIVMDRPETEPIFNKNFFPNHYRFLLQRINAYANSQRKMCVIAFDSQDEGNDKIISDRMKNYLLSPVREGII